MNTPREGIAELIRDRYLTIGDDAKAQAAERGLASYDELLDALCGLVGGRGMEGDLFSDQAFAAAKRAVANAIQHQ